MAIFNEVLSARFSRSIQKLFSMKGPAAVRQVAGEIQPAVQFFTGEENRYLESWNEYTVASQQPGVAAQFSALQFRNPASSNVIMVLEMVSVFESASDQMNLSHAFTNPADLATVLPPAAALDSRSGVAGVPTNSVAVLSRTTLGAVTDLGAGAQPGAVSGANVPYQYIQTDNQEIPVLPGTAYRICAQVANTTLTWGVRWRERHLEESERT